MQGRRELAMLPLLLAAAGLTPGATTVLENSGVRLEIDDSTGCFTVTEKVSGRVWKPDPWEGAAAQIYLTNRSGASVAANLSTSEHITIARRQTSAAQVTFRSPTTRNGTRLDGLEVRTLLSLDPAAPVLTASVEGVTAPAGYRAVDLEYPLRQFSLRTEADRGMGVIPYVQGVVVPSYMYPMRNSKFGHYDDGMYNDKVATGEMAVYGGMGLQMPWYGLQTDKSAVMVLLPASGAVRMKYILNYNDKERINRERHVESSYPRILSLYPVWSLARLKKDDQVAFRFMPAAGYVEMAKQYRALAKERGLFVSLRDKMKRAPGVAQMAGDIYLHIYGGYPHYVNFPGMEIDFKELQGIIRDLHDELKVRKAFLTVWGTWENYPPFHWPVNVKAGGVAELRKAFDLAKSYGYLITPYHSWSALLQHDPKYDPSLLPRGPDGQPLIRGRWNTIDEQHWGRFARSVLAKEIEALGSNATYSDTRQNDDLRLYLSTLGIPATQERIGDSELSVPVFHRFEGLAPHNSKKDALPFVEAPLFNLVYHDAVMTTNRWQSPDNDYDLNGDYAVRCLRNMLYGNGVMLVAPPFEYPGVRPYIRHAVQLMAPLHEETALEELVSHEYLSTNMEVQRSRFANGTEVTVNLGLPAQTLKDGSSLPGRGFRIRHSDGPVTEGAFRVALEIRAPSRPERGSRK